MYSAYKLNKQGDNIQPWRTPFPTWNQSVVPCPILTVASWPTYRFLKRQVRWSGIPISFRIFHITTGIIQVENVAFWTAKYSLWRRRWHPTPVLLPGESHGQRSLVGFSPWGRKESDMTERLHFHFSLSCIGEGNGNPLQCFCLENPRNGGAWWVLSMGSHRVGNNWSDLAANILWSLCHLRKVVSNRRYT